VNVGIVTTWFERGAAIVSRAYVDALRNKHNVLVYARGGEKHGLADPAWDSPYVTWGKVVGYSDTAIDWKDFQRWIVDNGIEFVIFNEQQSWRVILRAVKLKLVIGAYVDYYTIGTYRFFWLYDFLLCNTLRHYSLFKEHPSAVYIPWGTDLQIFRPQPRMQSSAEVVFFHSCGVSPYRKGTDILVKAFKNVSGKARLIVHSQGRFQNNSPVMSAISADHRITLIEREVSAPGLYHLGDVYVYPTRLEGIGLTIAEALASGLPVITTNAPPMSEFVVDGVNGKLVDVAFHRRREDDYYWPMSICDGTRLTQAMQFFVNNPSEVQEYQAGARKYAEAKLDWRENSKPLPEMIEKYIHRQQLDEELMRAVARFDSQMNRYPPFVEPLVPALRKLGIAKLRRAVKGQDSA
jgi:1,2-diacylglycerol 3-alpha-glucosyltransferase